MAVIRSHRGGFLGTAEGIQRFLDYYPPTYHPVEDSIDHWTPTLWVAGLDDHTGAVSNRDSLRAAYNASISSRLAADSPLAMTLEVEYGASGDSGTVSVEVVATDVITFTGLHLRLALIESGISYAGHLNDQILRDFVPDDEGIPFALAQGDTFAHVQGFAIDTAWVAEHCGMVAFVQDDTTREVVQAVQSPVVAAPPEQVANLTVTLSGDDLALAWSPVVLDTGGHPLTVDHYVVYRDTVGFFGPGSDPFTTTGDTFYDDASGVVGDLGVQYYYAVTAVGGGKESVFSGAAGEFDRHLVAGK